MDLKEKLRQLNPGLESRFSKPDGFVRKIIDRFIDGEEISCDFGNCFHTLSVFPETQKHGRFTLDLPADIPKHIFGQVAKDDTLSGVNLKEALFIDAETTGLAGGAGTVLFLIGLGYFYDDGFRVEQFFMRDFDEELSVLHHVAERIKNASALVSYNGKAYDLNLLTSRYTLARMANPFSDLLHLDLLHPVRRIWRRRIGDCSLSNIEKEVLGFYRQGDIPGFMIPGLYFDYLRSGDAQSLEPVFTHNRWDIVTLVVLAAVTGRIYSDPVRYLDQPLDLYCLGKAMKELFDLKRASICFKTALNYPLVEEDKEEILRSLGFLFKQTSDWDGAVRVWEQMIQHRFVGVLPYEELAKYYEHREKDYEKAIDMVNRALERLSIFEQLSSAYSVHTDRCDLEYRLRRLEKKRFL